MRSTRLALTAAAPRIRDYIRSNVVGYVVLFFALSGTAYATHPGGANTISTGDIIDGQVKSLDLGNGEVKGEDLAANSVGDAKINDRSVKNADLGIGASSSNTIADGGIQGIDVKDGTLTIPKLSFDPATQAELGELASSDASPPNTGSNLVHWDVFHGVPAGFADGVDDVGSANAWSLSGNSGTGASDFLGTSDDTSLNLRVNGARALRLEPASNGSSPSPNLIGGSANNTVTAGVFGATIGGGGRVFPFNDPATANRVTDNLGTVGGGANNQAGDGDADPGDASRATVGGGVQNTASGTQGTVGGGAENSAGIQGTVGGGAENSAGGLGATVGGGGGNSASGLQATVGGGQLNTVSADWATVGGGTGNTVVGQRATVGGGESNAASQTRATVGGGNSNSASGEEATVGGGNGNEASATWATVAGGQGNIASGESAAVAGASNIASGGWATVPGGAGNLAQGTVSFAAGNSANAAHAGAFVWADNSPVTATQMSSTAANQFIARAAGRFFLQSDSGLDDQGGFINTSTGGFLSTGGQWTNSSDRSLKHRFAALEPGTVLRKLTRLPVRSWSYKAEPGVRHIGPVAQDFHRLFQVGADNRHIGTVDEAGVALAAIKALAAQNQQLNRTLRSESRRRSRQARRIARLERLVEAAS